MNSPVASWQEYEAIARSVLHDLRNHLGITAVSADTDLPGKSGTSWRVEGTAIRLSDGATVIIECRRYTTKNLNQEAVGGIAFRISDTGSGGALLVTPLPLQEGADLVAASESIAHVILDPTSTTESYLAKFLGQTFHGVSASSTAHASSSAEITVTRKGKVIESGT